MRRVIYGDNLPLLRSIPDGSIPLIYIDPPFNTGKTQSRRQLRTIQAEDGDRTGFQGRRYHTAVVAERAFADAFDEHEYLAFLEPRLIEAHRVLAPNGSIYFHIDYREAHYCKLLLDAIFGRDCFLNEIVWAYDYGARTKRRWPPKHDTIFFYVKNRRDYVFNAEAVDREPYMAPGLVTPEKAARGKLPTDVWWHTIVSPNGREKTGYPTQKPLGVLSRIVAASSNPGDLVLDFFAGSGTTGVAAADLGRGFLLVDDNEQALAVMAKRFAGLDGVEFVGYDPVRLCPTAHENTGAGAPSRRDGDVEEGLMPSRSEDVGEGFMPSREHVGEGFMPSRGVGYHPPRRNTNPTPDR